MAFETTKDVIDHARKFHRDLSEFYHQLADSAEQEKVKMVLDYLSRHERHLDQALARYEHDGANQVLDTWFKFKPDEATAKNIAALEVNNNMTVPEIVRMAMQMDERLIELYRGVARSSVAEEVKELFESLLKMEKQEESDMVKLAMGFDRDF